MRNVWDILPSVRTVHAESGEQVRSARRASIAERTPVLLKKCPLVRQVSLDDVSTRYSDTQVQVRTSTYDVERTVLETEGAVSTVALRDAVELVTSGDNAQTHYVSYQYCSQLFGDTSIFTEVVDWEALGYTESDVQYGLTLWVGSPQSHTPMHYDTYGVNTVIQLDGMKRWLLCDAARGPGSSLASRVPYEESTVFSRWDPRDPTSHKSVPQGALQCVMEPGDVLFVPRHFWHFVENLSPSLSINCWQDVPNDDEERCKERLVRVFASILLPFAGGNTVNTGEELADPREEVAQLANDMGVPEQEDMAEILFDVLTQKFVVEGVLERIRTRTQRRAESHSRC